MFRDLYNSASMVLSWRWPRAEGVVTTVRVAPYRSGLKIVLEYKFSVDEQGPYAGESEAPSWFGGTEMLNVNKAFQIGQSVTIRYRRDDPSINTIDWSWWQDIEDGL